jgi:hypothetical protein
MGRSSAQDRRYRTGDPGFLSDVSVPARYGVVDMNRAFDDYLNALVNN